jgi:hypothetical protein
MVNPMNSQIKLLTKIKKRKMLKRKTEIKKK